MYKTLIAALMMLSASFVYAQNDVDYEMLNVRSQGAQAATAAITPPPAGATGQGAPYYHGSYQTSWYAQPTYSNGDVIYRYQNVKQALSQYAGYYGWFSRERQYYNQAAQQGEDLYVRYLQYRDAYSAAALSNWCQQWEYQFGYGGSYQYTGWNTGGWNTGYSCSCYVDRWGRQVTSNCQLHYSYYSNNGWNNGGYHNCGCYHDGYGRRISRNCRTHGYYYPQGSYGYPEYHANNNYISGLQIGNGIGNIVQGSRYDNGLQTAGGVLSTVGGVLNVIDAFRR